MPCNTPDPNKSYFSEQDLELLASVTNGGDLVETPLLTEHNLIETHEENLEFSIGCDSAPIMHSLQVPSLEQFPGIYNFTVKLKPGPVSRLSYLYSSLLDQVFIDMRKVLMVQFHLSDVISGMSVRAVPVYSSPDSITFPVMRCPLHCSEDDPAQKAHAEDEECHCYEYHLSGHVLRTLAPDARYDYDKWSQRHSVLVPLWIPQAGCEFTEVPYFFTCKTSCARGMQRRPIHLVFILEDQRGVVLGRSSLAVKICSCPKRDKDKAERECENFKEPPTKKKIMTSQYNSYFAKKEIKYEVIHQSKEEKRARRKQLLTEIRESIKECQKKFEELENLCD